MCVPFPTATDGSLTGLGHTRRGGEEGRAGILQESSAGGLRLSSLNGV